MAPLLEAFRDRFPAGVINVIYGSGRETVSALMASGKIDIFAFISNKAASDLKSCIPNHRLRAALGLDAKNPGIVLPQVDLDNAVSEALTGSLSFNGQRCTALKVCLCMKTWSRSPASKFNQKLAARRHAVGRRRVADAAAGSGRQGDFLTALVADATQHGAQVVNAQGNGVSRGCSTPGGAVRRYEPANACVL